MVNLNTIHNFNDFRFLHSYILVQISLKFWICLLIYYSDLVILKLADKCKIIIWINIVYIYRYIRVQTHNLFYNNKCFLKVVSYCQIVCVKKQPKIVFFSIFIHNLMFWLISNTTSTFNWFENSNFKCVKLFVYIVFKKPSAIIISYKPIVLPTN